VKTYLNEVIESEDSITSKFKFIIDDRYIVEFVLVERPEKNIICFPSQIGCIGTCVFCKSGKFIRDLSEIDYYSQVALGNVYDAERLYKFGRNALVGSTEVLLAAGGIYGLPLTAETIVVTSTSGSDVDQGAGAWAIHIYGLDALGYKRDEIITMGATSIGTYLRVFRAHVEEAGNLDPVGGGNIGIISMTQTTSAIPMVIISPNDSQTLCACYTVPMGFTALIHSADTTTGAGKNSTNRLKYREKHDGILHPFRTGGIRDNFENTVGQQFKIPGAIPALTDIVFTCKSTASGTAVSGSFLLELIED
jgi:hypothetical protein